jgi:hypothetical protein
MSGISPSSEEFADLVFAVSLLWKSVESLTARIGELEAARSTVRLVDRCAERVDGVTQDVEQEADGLRLVSARLKVRRRP